MFKYKTTAAAVLASMLLLSSPVMGAGGGGDESEDDVSNEMTYITIGLIVVLGGLFLLDVLADSDEDTVSADLVADDQIIETGVNWDEVFTDDALITIAVSVFPGESGSETAMQFINVLNELAGDNITVYDDPLDLGTDSAVHRATMAHEYFGVDYLIFQMEDSETVQYAIASQDSILWTSMEQSDNSILVVASELLQSGVF